MQNSNFVQCMACLIFVFSLNACGGSTSPANSESSATVSGTPASIISQLETTGGIPKLDRSDSLVGPDANSNGVRDDIDTYIQNTFKDAQQRAAATQSAKALQSALLVDVANTLATKAVSQRIANATNCLFSRFSDNQGDFSPATIGDRLESITANTKIRMKAYLAYNKSRDGSSSSLPKGDTCE